MVDNQHRQIDGYRELTQEDIDMMNLLKTQEKDMMLALDTMQNDPRYNPRSVAVARTHLQTGYMWLIRAVARPNGE